MTNFEKTIRKKMIDTGVRVVDISRALDITSPSVIGFIRGVSKSQRFDAWVQENLGLDLEELREETVAV